LPFGQIGVTVFCPRDLPTVPHRLRLRGAHGLDDRQRRQSLDRLTKISRLSHCGLSSTAIQSATEGVLSVLRAAASYPRVLEPITANYLARNLQDVLEAHFADVRHSLLGAIRHELAGRRLLLSHRYAPAYPSVRLLGGGTGTEPCPLCRSRTCTWRYQDDLTGLGTRHVVICDRCGIIADHPVPRELHIQLSPLPAITASSQTGGVTLGNCSARKIMVSFTVQFDWWKHLGIEVSPAVQDVTLEPAQVWEGHVEILCERRLHDDIYILQVFALTDDCELYCASLKTISLQKWWRDANQTGSPSHHITHL
jgi:hypothetical protein